MFDKILIANRGEIACRVIRTARRLGIQTVAVYSEADAEARHVELADEAYPIGPAPARDSYLAGDKIIAAAKASGAQAIHPGYGFLSENADFAEACAAAGLVFIGPPAGAIRAMGSKSAAKALMERSDVPLVPGYHGEDQDPAVLAQAAARIGYPVLVKASAGGGGKGMRVVETAGDFAAALESARREAAASFGDDRVLVEKYLTRPRHIEIQVFADGRGRTVSLFERDCSIQRRHQKVVEEAPAPGLGPERRRAMGEAACAAARAIGYVGAGTVEFIAEGDAFYFMEMNTRLQVEHPVTEMITGLDLVEWQLRVAAGEPLPAEADSLAITGHAIEVRVYAEDPDRDFLPATGRITHLRTPAEGPHVRLDTGIRQGDAIGIHYDPMIAKLIVWDRDRPAAIRRLRAALAGYEVAGVQTNLAFLRRIAAEPDFRAGPVDTGFIARHAAHLLPPAVRPDARVLAAAVLSLHLDRPKSGTDPWSDRSGWRLTGNAAERFTLRHNHDTLTLSLRVLGTGYELTLPDGETHRLDGTREADGILRLRLDGVQTRLSTARRGDELFVFDAAGTHRFHLVDPLTPAQSERSGAGRLTAPMPGRIVRIAVEPGQRVARGTTLLVLEAMKMEHAIAAPADGEVETLRYGLGDLVEDGAELVGFKAKAEEAAA